MTEKIKFYGIIPARYDAVRFPGKPLALILGKPMIWHVYQRAKACPELSDVVLATDDERIIDAAGKYDIPALMTRRDHASGTDRVLEAARQLRISRHDVVVNIQGDEPALESEMLSQLVAPFSDPLVQVTTLARSIDAKTAQNPDRVKVVFRENGDALYFSRAPIPFAARGAKAPIHLHVGLYAFRMEILERFSALGASRLETTEKLEQLRLLENNIPIRVVITQFHSIGVDRPEDVTAVSRHLTAANAKIMHGSDSSI